MLTAKDLLHRGLEYDAFWGAKSMKDTPPAKARKEQLDKLLDAFGIMRKNAKSPSWIQREVGPDVTVEAMYSFSGRRKPMNRLQYVKSLTEFGYFKSGEFIADTDPAKYDRVLAKLIERLKAIFPEQLERIKEDRINMVHLFSSLYNFRHTVYHISEFELNMRANVTVSVEDDYTFHLRKNFVESMGGSLIEIDTTLCMFIDPDHRQFREEEIGYPDFDLKALDQEWLLERRNETNKKTVN